MVISELPNDTPDEGNVPETMDISQQQKAESTVVVERVTVAVQTLLAGSEIKDPVDRKVLQEALACLNDPEKYDAELVRLHAESVSQVICFSYVQGEDAPPVLNDLHNVLLVLTFRGHLSLIQAESKNSPPDFIKLKNWGSTLLCCAQQLVKPQPSGYGHPTYLVVAKQSAHRIQELADQYAPGTQIRILK